MSTYKELIYLCLDELKLTSDDSIFTEDHVMFLLDKYRAFILKQRYSDIKKQIPESNYQTICMDLEVVSAIPDNSCGGYYLRSKEAIPTLMKIGNPVVYATDYFQGDISLVSRDRMKYVGHNKFLSNIIYASVGPDNYLYFKSCNPQHRYLEKVRMTGIFESPSKALELQCSTNEDAVCDIKDMEFPLEEALIPPVTELVIKELSLATYRPEDSDNNASDDLSNLTKPTQRSSRTN